MIQTVSHVDLNEILNETIKKTIQKYFKNANAYYLIKTLFFNFKLNN